MVLLFVSVRPSSVIGPFDPVNVSTPEPPTVSEPLPVIVPPDHVGVPVNETAPVPPSVPLLMLMLGTPLNAVVVLMFSVPPATLNVPEPNTAPLSSNVPFVKLMMLLALVTLSVPVDLPPPAMLRGPVALFVTTPPAMSRLARIDEPIVPADLNSCAEAPLIRSVPAPEGTAWTS